jgi:membrane-anchored protein YejM (alkaline phosphatase superfamily)
MGAMARRRFSGPPERSSTTGGRSPRRVLLRWAGWCAAANTLLLTLVFTRNLAVTEIPDGWLPGTFATLMLLGQAALLACAPLLALVPLVLAWPRRAPVLVTGTLCSFLLCGTILIDTVVYRQYRFHLNAEVLNLLLGGAADEILVFPTRMYVQAALVAIGILVAQAALAAVVWRAVRSRPGGRLGPALGIGLASAFLAQAGLHAWADLAGYTPVTRQQRLLPGYLPATTENLFRKLGFEVHRAGVELGAADRGSGLSYPRRPLQCDPAPERPHLLFVVIDAWRFDALTPEVTPHLARLAASSLQFEDHLSGGSATRTGIFSLFYAIPGTYWHAMLAERRGPVFVEALERQGYEIAVFSSSKLVNPEFHRTVFADVEDLRMRSEGSGSAERDADATEDLLRFLERRPAGRPFFALLFLDAPHAYDLPEGFPEPFQPSVDGVNYLALSDDSDPVPVRNRYLNCVRFDDALVGRVLEALEREGLLDDTLIVATGDHGQEFNDNRLNYWGHDSNFSRYQVGVPLLLHWPGRGPASIAHRTSHYDLVPTLLDELFGCRNDYADYSVGRHLLEPGGRDALLLANFTDYAVVRPDRILAVYPFGVEVLDPGYRPIPGATPDRAAMLAALELRGRFYR